MVTLDPENPIVRLSMAGMRAKGEGRLDQARDLFSQAWAARREAFEAGIAAHYVARHQDSPEETLCWNEEALRQAQAVGERCEDMVRSGIENGRARVAQ